jgi:rare lipoprotein A
MVAIGKASWYGQKFEGRKTASGDVFKMYKKTAAHQTLPFNTMLRITNLSNGKSETVRVNDRGPFKKSRMIDVSYAVAKQIGLLSSGTTKVKVEILGFNKKITTKFRASKTSKKEDCVDCYASIPETNNSYSYKITASDTYAKNSDEKDDSTVVPSSSPIYAKVKTKKSSNKIAIQVGAFRRYAGAKVYAKKYDLLSNGYGVKIEAGVKNQKPLYRVKIEGFTTRSEALEFKRKYSLTGAFLVMK